MHTHEPINWETLALVGFTNNRPVVITSIEPYVLADTFSILAKRQIDDDEWDDEFEEHINISDIVEAVDNYRWELHSVEIAKEIFCSYPREEQKAEDSGNIESGEKPPQPLPGQLTLPLSEN